MNKRLKKAALNAVKLLVMAVLLAWVFSKVHWNDYVRVKSSGEELTVLSAQPNWDDPQTLTVSKGLLGRRTEQSLPIDQVEPLVAAPKAGEAATNPATPRERYLRYGVGGALKGMHVSFLALGLGGYLLSTLVIAVRWWFLLRIQDIRIPLWEAVRLTFLGLIFNSVIPGTVGGDLMKAWYVAKHTPRKAAVLVSIFVDRVMGLAEMTLLAGVMVVVAGLMEGSFQKVHWPLIMVGVVTAIVAFALTFLLSAPFRGLFRLQKLYQRLPIAHHFAAAGDAAQLYRQRMSKLVKVILMTVGSQVIWICSIGMLGIGLHLNIPFYSYLVYIPLIYIIGAVPVTPGGVGLIEMLYVQFFATGGVNSSMVIALALLARLMPIIVGLPGIIVYVTGPKLPKTSAIEQELIAEAEAEETK